MSIGFKATPIEGGYRFTLLEEGEGRPGSRKAPSTDAQISPVVDELTEFINGVEITIPKGR